jgi:hypothetical protein
MQKRPRILLILAAVLAAASLLALDAYRRLHDAAASSREPALSLMPTEATAVIFADLAELRRTTFSGDLYNWVPKTQADADYAQFLRETGFDYERDLDRAAIALIKDESETHFFAIAEGRFDRKKIETYASRSGTRENHGGREIFFQPLGAGIRRISFTFLSNGKMALTDATDISRFLSSSPDTSDAREWRERFTRTAGSPMFALIRQNAAAGSALASRAPGGFQSPQLSALLDQLQWISLAGKPQDNALRIVVEGECTSEQITRQLADLLNGVLLMAQAGLSSPKTRQQLDPRIREAYLELIKGADVSRLDRGETKSVRVVFDVTPRLLAAAAFAPQAPTPALPAHNAQTRPQKTRRN